MEKTKDILFRSSMSYGLLMGLFWAFKYIFFIFSISSPFLSFIYWGLTAFVPIVLGFFLLHFHLISPYNITFRRDWALGVLIYFFAALFVSLEHFVFYRYFAPPGFISESLQSTIDVIRDSDLSENVKEAVAAMPAPTPIQMTLQGIVNNLIYGILISFPVALFTYRFKVKIKNNEKKQ
ncbi:MAG: DUF4199 domain-containing protein [Massilibacteroides sp.]|nr:DUF4199 domain-containing protein [Massilibacteroides sp.]